MTDDKKERVWNDPLVGEALHAASRDTVWRVMFIGGLYLLTGIILYAVLNYSDVPVDMVPGLYMVIGGVFLLLSGVLHRRLKR